MFGSSTNKITAVRKCEEGKGNLAYSVGDYWRVVADKVAKVGWDPFLEEFGLLIL